VPPTERPSDSRKPRCAASLPQYGSAVEGRSAGQLGDRATRSTCGFAATTVTSLGAGRRWGWALAMPR
jgi:hypothetical protein